MKKLLLSLLLISNLGIINLVQAEKEKCYCGVGCTVRENGDVDGDNPKCRETHTEYGKLLLCQKRDVKAFKKNSCQPSHDELAQLPVDCSQQNR